MTTLIPKPMLPTITVLALLSLSAAPLAEVANDSSPPLRGLLIQGGCCHDYVNQEPIITNGLSARAQIEWTTVREGTDRNHKVALYDKPGWADGYDVVVHNECFGMVGDREFIEKIVAPHRKGVPAVFLHCSAHSYRALKTNEWRELLGVTSRRHGPQQPLQVKNLQPEHPIMKGFPAVWPTGKEELYIIEKVWPDTVPLAQAHDAMENSDHPVVWTHQLGKTRVFGTTLAHNNDTMRNPAFLDMLARGLLWSCGKLDDQGKPLPGYGPSGSR